VPARSILIRDTKPAMRLEFHQLDRRWEHLRVRHPVRHRRLLASLAATGQQTPIVVVAIQGQPDRYLVIDGYQRIAALQQLGRDTVEAVLWPMSEAEALQLDGSLRWTEQQSALEQGWFLAELEQRFGYGLEELARRFDRSVSWVSRRLALVELLPEAIQQQVREGRIAAQVAMKYLVPAARLSLEHCERLAAIFAQHHCDTRAAGQLYTAWRDGSPKVRERILAAPELFFKTQRRAMASGELQLERDLEMAAAILRRTGRQLGEALPQMDVTEQQKIRCRLAAARRELDRMVEQLEKERPAAHADPSATNRDFGTPRQGGEQARDCTRAGRLPPERAQGAAIQCHPGSGDPPCREGRALPATHPGSVQQLQGESRASP
jgi:ParB family transcriptional regulator, chromosome partitioning protein